ncbi:aggregation-promoting factor C-terminal-like domain-containing protein [Microbacterium halophytorum]|uniref:aggregation-promoting factor C-terminal-like domain-containing protein n=1 Tax=Microbacterium halophytorum TaxID=2067568 RepID=UPI001E63B7E9|nr:transglycosylase SLT domain-containing protein [Microbacterium halophytorum]
MTPDTPQKQKQTTLSRRETRALMQDAGLIERREKQAWSVKRTVTTALAGVGALALVGAFAAPSLGAFSDPAEAAATIQTTSAFEDTLAEAQVYAADENVEPMALQSSAYEVYVKPKPKPKPKPEPETASNEGDSDSSGESSGDSGGGGSAPSPFYSGGGSKEEWLTAAGIAESDWGYVDYIANRESGWNPNATNPTSGACGIIQALPCSKVPGSGYDPVDNLRWANGYAIDRYGSWAAAYSFWTANHWW